jgi:hypothetical protein
MNPEEWLSGTRLRGCWAICIYPAPEILRGYSRSYSAFTPCRFTMVMSLWLKNYPNTLRTAQTTKKLDLRFSTEVPLTQRLLNSRHTKQGAKIVKAHHQFLRRDFIIKIMSINILFKSSIAKILIIVLFLKIMLITDFQNLLKFMFVFVIIPNMEMRYH